MLMPLILPTSANETIYTQTGFYYPVLSLPGPLSQQEHCKMLYSTQTGTDDMLFRSMIDLLLLLSFFFFNYLWLDAGRYFSFHSFSILCLWPNWYCPNKWRVSFTLFQNCFCPHVALQSTQNGNSSEWL